MISKLIGDIHWDELEGRIDSFIKENPEIYFNPGSGMTFDASFIFAANFLNGKDKFFRPDFFEDHFIEDYIKLDLLEIKKDFMKLDLKELKDHMVYYYFRTCRKFKGTEFLGLLEFSPKQLEILGEDGKNEIEQIFNSIKFETNLEAVFTLLDKNRKLLKSI